MSVGVLDFPLDWRDCWRRLMLDARKLARIAANRARIRTGRTTRVALVWLQSGGALTALAADIVLKQGGMSEPSMVDQEGLVVSEWLADINLSYDVPGMAYIALTGGAIDSASIASAVQLAVVSYHTVGLAADRYLVALRRNR